VDGALVSWYADDVAEPNTSDEAYGYWSFVIGSVLGVVGFALFLLSTTATKGTSAFWTTGRSRSPSARWRCRC
jgi:hypothetical protein